ncbi:hypothetical protein D1872_265560 [compost metagenome]
MGFSLVINRVNGEGEARQVADKISLVAKQFLNLDIPTLGYLSDDSHVMQAVKKQVPFSAAFPGCAASRDIKRLAMKYMDVPRERSNETLSGIKGFVHKWLRRAK